MWQASCCQTHMHIHLLCAAMPQEHMVAVIIFFLVQIQMVTSSQSCARISLNNVILLSTNQNPEVKFRVEESVNVLVRVLHS